MENLGWKEIETISKLKLAQCTVAKEGSHAGIIHFP